MTRGISRRHVYMPPLDDAMRALSGQLQLCPGWSLAVASWQHNIGHFWSCDCDLDPMTFIFERDPYYLEIYRMCKYELSASRLSKVIVWQTYSHSCTQWIEIIYIYIYIYILNLYAGGQKSVEISRRYTIKFRLLRFYGSQCIYNLRILRHMSAQ